MNEKQQQLTFDKGITNVPSDALCSDNALEELVGLVYDDGEHRVIQKPKEFITSAVFGGISQAIPKILYVHKFNDQVRYIVTNDTNLYWGTVSDSTFTFSASLRAVTNLSSISITSIGKTLVISDNKDLYYYIWKDDGYADATNIPKPDVRFFLYGNNDYYVYWTRKPDIDPVEEQETFNDLVVGLYSKIKKSICQKKAFCLPFFVRTAVELYDGSYTHISQPILMFPSVTRNTKVSNVSWTNEIMKSVSGFTHFRKLYYVNKSNIDHDYCKCIAVFVSPPIDIYDTVVDQKYQSYASTDHYGVDGVYRESLNGGSFYHNSQDVVRDIFTCRSASDIENDIKSTSVFYKLCEIDLKGDSQPHDIGEKIESTHTLENLTTLPMLENDDYFSFCKMKAPFLYAYNSRLNIARAERELFEGFDFFVGWDNFPDGYTYNIYVKIETDIGNFVVQHTTLSTISKQGIWFFYPDSRATYVRIVNNHGTTVLNARLTEHPGLNGAYYFAGLPSSSGPNPDTSGGFDDGPSQSVIESLPNRIIQSEANNPFLFKAEGYFRVGTGKILGMSSTTQALSEGQFGQYPLLVFSESGIWALSVGTTGYYTSISPMSREVCNNPKSITQTDGAIFFASEKGLMVVNGNQVRCVSEQLSSISTDRASNISTLHFQEYLAGAFIAYDYRDSLLWIFNDNSGYEEYCYIYSIKNGTFSKFCFPVNIDRVVNDYPDYALQDRNKVVYTLIERDHPAYDANNYAATIISRPMKLENALALKSIMQVKHIHTLSSSATMTLQIYASNNLTNWVELHSLRGTPWKYYRFKYNFTNLVATDRFAGTVLITQERRTNKLR